MTLCFSLAETQIRRCMLQVINVPYRCLVDAFLYQPPDHTVDWIEVWWVHWPEIRSSEVWSFTMFVQDHLNGTCAYAHSVSYQLHTDSTILQNCIFNSTTVFVADSCRRTFLPALIFKTSSAMTELAAQQFTMALWWHMFTINNSHSAVYLLCLNVLLCQKFCNCTIADFMKISHNVQLAFVNILYLTQ